MRDKEGRRGKHLVETGKIVTADVYWTEGGATRVAVETIAE